MLRVIFIMRVLSITQLSYSARAIFSGSCFCGNYNSDKHRKKSYVYNLFIPSRRKKLQYQYTPLYTIYYIVCNIHYTLALYTIFNTIILNTVSCILYSVYHTVHCTIFHSSDYLIVVYYKLLKDSLKSFA